MRTVLGLALLNATAIAQCDDTRSVRLWIHQDMTGSFNDLVHSATHSMQTLLEGLPNLVDVGYSLFMDRDKESPFCFDQLAGFESTTPGKSALQVKITDLMERINAIPSNLGGDDAPEDSLSGLPLIAKQQFGYGDPGDVHRFLIIITDRPGKYHGAPNIHFDGDLELLQRPEDSVTCNRNYRFPYLNEVFDPINKAHVHVILLATQDLDWYELIFQQQKVDYTLFQFTADNEFKLVSAISDSIRQARCDTTTTAPPTTEAPTQPPTEAPTQPPTEAPTQAPTEAPTQPPTEAPTQPPTEAPTQAPTEPPTVQPVDSTTTTTVGTTTTAAPPTPRGGNNAGTIAGASAGALAGLGALSGLAYKKLHPSPTFDADMEEEAADEVTTDMRSRETMARIDEDEFV